jgi:hypothetical protein
VSEAWGFVPSTAKIKVKSEPKNPESSRPEAVLRKTL